MTITFTEHFRFGIPDFLSEPWHITFEALVQDIDRALYNALIGAGFTVWANSTVYAVGSTVIDPVDGSLWFSNIAHTSAASPTTFAQDRAANPAYWGVFGEAGGPGTGDVIGPASATDNAIARFDLTSGKVIQNSNAHISDTGAMTAASFTPLGTAVPPNGIYQPFPGVLGIGLNNAPEVWFEAGALIPAFNDGVSLGHGANAWSDLSLADGGVINWGNNGVRIDHVPGNDGLIILLDPANLLPGTQFSMSVDGGVELNLDKDRLAPGVNDGLALGAVGTAWADLFLADAGVIDFGNAGVQFHHVPVNDGLSIQLDPTNSLPGTQLAMSVDGGVELILDVFTLSPGVNDGLSLGDSSKGWADIFLADGAVINWSNGGVEFHHVPVNDGLIILLDPLNALPNTQFAMSVDGGVELTLDATCLCPAVNDGLALGDTSKGWADLFLADAGVINWSNGGVEIHHVPGNDGLIILLDPANLLPGTQFAMSVDGGVELNLDVDRLAPGVNDGLRLGAPGTAWSDLFLADAGVIDFGNAGVEFHHVPVNDGLIILLDPTNSLPGTQLAMSVDGGVELLLDASTLAPGVDGGLSLGTVGNAWQNLFANTGFVINVEVGNWVATHTSGILTINPGDLQVTTPGTAAASVVTNQGTQRLVNKTIIEAVVTLTDGVNVSLDAALGNTFYLAANGSRTILTPTNKPSAGQSQKITIRHEAIGADRTLTLTTGSAGAFRFGAFVTSPLAATLNGTVDYIGAIYNALDDRWDVVSLSKGF